jgi:transposase
MSTSLLYHAWGIRGYRYVRTRYQEGGVCFVIEQVPQTFRCANCGSSDVVKAGQVVRHFHALPVWPHPVSIELPVQRLWCSSCGKTRQAKVTFADERRSYIHTFERYALELCRRMTMLDVAHHLGVGWDVIKDIQSRYLQRRFAKPKLKDLKHIAIDEISVGKGHRFVTVVLDLDSGAVVFVGEGRGADSLDRFWRRLNGAHARIHAVATDMSPAYTQAVRQHLPRAIHVFDRFHVVKLFNEKLTVFRRELFQRTKDELQKQVLKGTRWLLLKNPQNLDPQRNEQQRLEDALALNKPLAAAYYLKEDLRQLWEQDSRAEAERFLDDWLARARGSCIGILDDMARTLWRHREGLLAWYDCPISTGPLEGTNTKIKLMQHQAYGFRDHNFFKLKIYALHKTRYELVG